MEKIANVVKAQVLNQALPYIQKYHDTLDRVLLKLYWSTAAALKSVRCSKRSGLKAGSSAGCATPMQIPLKLSGWYWPVKSINRWFPRCSTTGGSALGLCGSDGQMLKVKKAGS